MSDLLVARTFVKEDGDRLLTRTVYTPTDEVEARFEGFTERKPSDTRATSSKSGGGSKGGA